MAELITPNQAVHLTGVSLRFTPAGDFYVRLAFRNEGGYNNREEIGPSWI